MLRTFTYLFLCTLFPSLVTAQTPGTAAVPKKPADTTVKANTPATTVVSKATGDATAVPGVTATVPTAKPTGDATPVPGAAAPGKTPGSESGAKGATTDPTKTPPPKRKTIYKVIDPGYQRPPVFRLSPMGPSAVWGGIGVKAGLTDNATGGFLVNLGYSYRITRRLWIDSSLSMNFGGDCSAPASDAEAYECGGMNGFGLDVLGGIMWRFLDKPRWDIPLNPYVKALGGISFIISNGPNDGAAVVVKGVGGARYSFTDEFAVGAELGLTFGPAFRNVTGAGSFIALDFLISAEYSF